MSIPRHTKKAQPKCEHDRLHHISDGNNSSSFPKDGFRIGLPKAFYTTAQGNASHLSWVGSSPRGLKRNTGCTELCRNSLQNAPRLLERWPHEVRKTGQFLLLPLQSHIVTSGSTSSCAQSSSPMVNIIVTSSAPSSSPAV